METKPYRIQSPEDIAKDYGGNKQKIVQAMQMGVVDPTAGVLAGMFIDRMRSAQAQEMAPQSSVAQQIMAPPPPPGAPPMGGMPPGAPPMGAPPAPAGLGATPEAAMMGAPPMGGMGPPMGAPPMGDMPPGAPPMGDMPPGAPPMGMADGGLAALPISDYMFDEPDNGGYAGGGIVAFADSGLTSPPTGGAVDEEIPVTASLYSDPYRYGYAPTFKGNMGLVEQYAPQQRKYGDKMTSFYEAEMTPEAQEKRKKQSDAAFLADLGFGMAASKSPTLFGAFGEAGMKAAPAAALRNKERREEQRDAIKMLAAREDMTNKQATETFKLASDMQKAYGGFMDADAMRKLTREMNEADNDTRMAAQRLANEGGENVANINKNATLSFYEKDAAKREGDIKAAAIKQLDELRTRPDNAIGKAHNAYKMAVQSKNPQAIADAVAAINMAERAYVASQVSLLGGVAPPNKSAEVGPVSGGKIVVQNGKRVFVPGG